MNEKIRVDGNLYDNCNFTNCIFIFGGELFDMTCCAIDSVNGSL